VACNDDINLALSEAGQVFEWGSELEQERWFKEQPRVPTVMKELRNHRVCQVAAGYDHCAAVTQDGFIFTWKTRDEEDADPDEPVPELSHGRLVHDWGVPHRVLAFRGVRIASVALGAAFTVAVTEAGAVFSFGLGDGCLGNGEYEEELFVYFPKRIEALDGIHVVAVAAGDRHALALTQRGQVYSWGPDGPHNPVNESDNDGDVDGGVDRGDGDAYVPQLVRALRGKRVRAIAAGRCSKSCAVTEAGALYTWGDNQRGNSGPRNRPKLAVTTLPGIHVVGVSIADEHTLVLAADGSVYSFGEGSGLGIRQGGEGGAAGEATGTPQRIPDLACMVPRR
jgi:alpha-tubulin suppressor-like RCC1 family protein